MRRSPLTARPAELGGVLQSLLQGVHARELHAALVLSQPGDRLDLDGDFELYPLVHDPLQLVLTEDHRRSGAPRRHGRSASPCSAPLPRAVLASWWGHSRNRRG
nr:hypothetical protein OG781_26070 [Streptomyces sp. NBC_00830]